MFKKVREKEKEFVIINRIKVLYEKMKLIYSCGCDCIKRFYEISEGDYYYCEIDTIYGKRYIEVSEDYKLYYGNNTVNDIVDKHKRNAGYFLSLLHIVFLFSISQKNNKIDIQPYPMVKFTPEEIDLAILEFEEYIEPLYKEAKEKAKKHEKCVEFFSKREGE